MKKRMERHAVTQPLDQSYRLIPLTQGQNALVDTEDFNRLSKFNWFAQWAEGSKTFYACRTKVISNIPRKQECIEMHREIMRCTPKEECDHKNHKGLDNRKFNLRRCNGTQNQGNRGKPKNNTSGFKGVHWHIRDRRWIANIWKYGKSIHVGCFSSAEAAARAYDAAAKKHFGEFACLNFPHGSAAGV